MLFICDPRMFRVAEQHFELLHFLFLPFLSKLSFPCMEALTESFLDPNHRHRSVNPFILPHVFSPFFSPFSPCLVYHFFVVDLCAVSNLKSVVPSTGVLALRLRPSANAVAMRLGFLPATAVAAAVVELEAASVHLIDSAIWKRTERERNESERPKNVRD